MLCREDRIPTGTFELGYGYISILAARMAHGVHGHIPQLPASWFSLILDCTIPYHTYHSCTLSTRTLIFFPFPVKTTHDSHCFDLDHRHLYCKESAATRSSTHSGSDNTSSRDNLHLRSRRPLSAPLTIPYADRQPLQGRQRSDLGGRNVESPGRRHSVP